MLVVCFDLEGVLMPEVWINVAEKTGIEELRRTTRDEPDYDKLMRYRLDILDEHGITIDDIQQVIATMHPMPGAKEFLDEVRARWQVLILSDTFYQFAEPMMVKLDRPTIYCHDLEIDEDSRMLTGWKIRLEDQKRVTVEGLRAMNFNTLAVGDSYNDTNMLAEAHAGILFRPPQNVIDEFPQFPVAEDYAALMSEIESIAADLGE
ncbi:MAG: bifunctional phosphoserine phosphatase/homoserine phosphotransferase ThrH [Candidatus Thermoplasmatota archaeon]|nr:bifunctional phosphoserine phosphatase/homoserine phosphotransferase ThrH [Candidatus Thermoplasmatota archaeon]